MHFYLLLGNNEQGTEMEKTRKMVSDILKDNIKKSAFAVWAKALFWGRERIFIIRGMC